MNDLPEIPVKRPSRAIVKLKRNRAIRRMGRRKFRLCDWLNPRHDAEDVESWARARRRRQEIDQILDEEGLRLPDGRVLTEARHWSVREMQLSDRLGFNPKARMEIRASGRNAPVDLASAMAAQEEVVDDADK